MYCSSCNACSPSNSYPNEAYKLILLMSKGDSLLIYPVWVKGPVRVWNGLGSCMFDLMSIISVLSFQAHMTFQADHYFNAEPQGSILSQTLTKKSTPYGLRYSSLLLFHRMKYIKKNPIVKSVNLKKMYSANMKKGRFRLFLHDQLFYLPNSDR